MTDLYSLFAKIQALPKRRVTEVDDFVDFLARRSVTRKTTPVLESLVDLRAIHEANRARRLADEAAARDRSAPNGGYDDRRRPA